MSLRARAKSGGYLLVLVTVCVCILSISFLRLAAKSAESDDQAELEVARSAAYYLAESGLVLVESQLDRLTSPPPVGPWLVGTLQTSGRYTVEVMAGAGQEEFAVRSIGQVEGEGARKVTVTVEARVTRERGKAWTVKERKRH